MTDSIDRADLQHPGFDHECLLLMPSSTELCDENCSHIPAVLDLSSKRWRGLWLWKVNQRRSGLPVNLCERKGAVSVLLAAGDVDGYNLNMRKASPLCGKCRGGVV